MIKRTFGFLVLATLVFNLAVWGFAITAGSSLVTSSLKVAAHECGTHYSIEDLPFVFGDLFCYSK